MNSRATARTLERKEQTQEEILENVRRFRDSTIPAIIELAKNSGSGSPTKWVGSGG